MFLLQVNLIYLNFEFSYLTVCYFLESINTLCRTDSDMSSSGYSEYRSDSWVDDDHTNKSSTLKRDKRPEFDRYVIMLL